MAAVVVGSRYGWVGREDPELLRYESSFVLTAKRNGKSPLEMAMVLYAAHHYWPRGGEARLMAATLEQVGRVQMLYLQRMIENDVLLRRTWRVRMTMKMTYPGSFESDRLGTKILAVPGMVDGSGYSGDFVHHVVMDEYHEVPDARMFEQVLMGMKSSRNGMVAVTTNAGLVGTPCHDLRGDFEDAMVRTRRGGAGSAGAARRFAFICENEWEDEPWLARNWREWQKSNPGLPWDKSQRDYIERGLGMVRDPEDAARKFFSIWRVSDFPLLRAAEWDGVLEKECPYGEEELAGARMLIGVDRGLSSNYTAVVKLWDMGGEGWVEAELLMPEGTVDREAQNDGMDYRAWAMRGHVEIEEGVSRSTPGFLADRLIGLVGSWDVHGLSYDAANMGEVLQLLREGSGKDWAEDLAESEYRPMLLEHAQGWKRGRPIRDSREGASKRSLEMTSSIEELMSMVRGGGYRLRILDTPAVRQCIANSHVKLSTDGRYGLEKRSAEDKNDFTVGLLHVVGLRALLWGSVASGGVGLDGDA